VAGLAQLSSTRLPWVQVDGLAEVSMERLEWMIMPTEHLEGVEAACVDLHSVQT